MKSQSISGLVFTSETEDINIQLGEFLVSNPDSVQLYSHTFELYSSGLEYSSFAIRIDTTVPKTQQNSPYSTVFAFHQGVPAPDIQITQIAQNSGWAFTHAELHFFPELPTDPNQPAPDSPVWISLAGQTHLTSAF